MLPLNNLYASYRFFYIIYIKGQLVIVDCHMRRTIARACTRPCIFTHFSAPRKLTHPFFLKVENFRVCRRWHSNYILPCRPDCFAGPRRQDHALRSAYHETCSTSRCRSWHESWLLLQFGNCQTHETTSSVVQRKQNLENHATTLPTNSIFGCVCQAATIV